jgi:hypothetical protein
MVMAMAFPESIAEAAVATKTAPMESLREDLTENDLEEALAGMETVLGATAGDEALRPVKDLMATAVEEMAGKAVARLLEREDEPAAPTLATGALYLGGGLVVATPHMS